MLLLKFVVKPKIIKVLSIFYQPSSSQCPNLFIKIIANKQNKQRKTHQKNV